MNIMEVLEFGRCSVGSNCLSPPTLSKFYSDSEDSLLLAGDDQYNHLIGLLEEGGGNGNGTGSTSRVSSADGANCSSVVVVESEKETKPETMQQLRQRLALVEAENGLMKERIRQLQQIATKPNGLHPQAPLTTNNIQTAAVQLPQVEVVTLETIQAEWVQRQKHRAQLLQLEKTAAKTNGNSLTSSQDNNNKATTTAATQNDGLGGVGATLTCQNLNLSEDFEKLRQIWSNSPPSPQQQQQQTIPTNTMGEEEDARLVASSSSSTSISTSPSAGILLKMLPPLGPTNMNMTKGCSPSPPTAAVAAAVANGPEWQEEVQKIRSEMSAMKKDHSTLMEQNSTILQQQSVLQKQFEIKCWETEALSTAIGHINMMGRCCQQLSPPPAPQPPSAPAATTTAAAVYQQQVQVAAPPPPPPRPQPPPPPPAPIQHIAIQSRPPFQLQMPQQPLPMPTVWRQSHHHQQAAFLVPHIFVPGARAFGGVQVHHQPQPPVVMPPPGILPPLPPPVMLQQQQMVMVPPRNYWNMEECHADLAIVNNGLTVIKHASFDFQQDFATVRARWPVVPTPGSRLFYFEVKITRRVNRIWVGLSGPDLGLHQSLGHQRGWGYFNFSGFFECGKVKAYGEQFDTGDTVGCGLDLQNGDLFFTLNGRNIGTATKLAIASTGQLAQHQLCPTLSMCGRGTVVEANFGDSPFLYKPGEDSK